MRLNTGEIDEAFDGCIEDDIKPSGGEALRSGAATATPNPSPQGGGEHSTAPVIEARNLDLVFETADTPVHALKGIDLTVNSGEFVSFIGPSGCGKTTLLRVIADLEQPTGGSISVNGMTPDQARQARAYGYVFQAAALYPWRTIEKNIALPLEIMGFDRAERANAGSTPISNSSALRVSAANIPGSCPAACSSGPPSPAHCVSTRTSS